MKSVEKGNTEEKYKKVTNVLWKIWWFFVFLFIIPSVITFLSFIIINYIATNVGIFHGSDVYIVVGLSIIIFIFSILFFYRYFDRYRNNPVFFNQENNLTARIHILYLITIFSLIVTPIYVYITPPTYQFEQFELLPLISFCILYNIVYFYYSLKPIDYFDPSERSFKRALRISLSLKQSYNYLILINYFTQIIYISLIFETNFSWLFGLINNGFFYIITLSSTAKIRKNISNSINKNAGFLDELTVFKQKFIFSMLGLDFVLIMQIPFVIILTNILQGYSYNIMEIVSAGIYVFIIFFLYVKFRIYVIINYKKLLLGVNPEDGETRKSEAISKYHKINGYISMLFEIIIILFSFLVNLPIIIVLSFPIFIILTIYEQKADICPKEYSRYIYLINITGFLAYFCFWLLPLWIPSIIFTVPVVVFLFTLYLSLQIFAHNEYFDKKNVLLFQHILAVGIFITIIYSFFNLISLVYVDFTTDYTAIILANILLHIQINLIIFLISFYYLYGRYFRNNPWKNLSRSITINILLIEIVAYLLINFRNFFILEFQAFLNYTLISLLLFPCLFIFFILLNYLIGILNRERSLSYCYYSCWGLLFISALSIFFSFFGDSLAMVLNCLYISIAIQILSKFGLKITKIKETSYKKIKNYVSFSVFIEIGLLFFFLFLNILDNLIPDPITRFISSGYLALPSVIIVNIVLYKMSIISKLIQTMVVNLFLFYTVFIAFYYAFLLTNNTLFVYNIPALFSSLSFNLVLFRLRKKESNRDLIKKLTQLNAVISSFLLLSIPTIAHLEFNLPLSDFTILNLINYTLYILFGILSFFLVFSKDLRLQVKRIGLISKFIIVIAFIMAITTVFYYPYKLLSGTNLVIILPLLLTSIYLYIPAYISLKKGIFNAAFLNKVLRFNSYAIFLEISILLFSLFYTLFGFMELIDNVVLSLYLTSIAITIINSELFKFHLISNTFKQLIIEYTLVLTSFIIFFYFYRFTSGTYYVFNIPALFCSLSFNLFLIKLKKRSSHQEIIKKLIQVNANLTSILLVSIPTIVYLELNLPLSDFTIFNLLNFTLYILCGILSFLLVLSENLKIRAKRIGLISKWLLLIAFVLTITTVFYYPYKFLSGSNLTIILPLLLASSYLYIPTYISLKKGFFNATFLKNVLRLNSYIIFAEISILLFSLFYTLLGFMELIDNIILSLYLTSVAITIISSLLFKLDFISNTVRLIIIEFTLFFTSCLIFFYFYQFVSGTYYIFNIPSLLSAISLYIPLLYIKSKIKYVKTVKILIQFVSVVFLGSILLFPTVISLEMASLGYTIDPITTTNFSLYILYGILASLYVLSRKLHFRDARKLLILKLHVIIEIIITGTTVYYYSYFLTLGTYISYVLPLLFSSLFLFIPIFFSYKRGFFHANFLKKIIILNSILFWGCLISIPFMIGMDMFGLEIFVSIISTNLTVVVIFSLFLTFLALKYFDSLFRYLKVNEKVIIRIKIVEILIWLLVCGLSSFGLFNTLLSSEWNLILVISCSLILFFFINLINLPLVENLKQTIFESETSRFDYYKVYKVYEFIKNVTIFGLTFSFASLLSSFIQILDIPRLLAVEYIEYLDIMIIISSFFFFVLIILKLFDSLLKIEYERFKEVCQLVFWLGLKGLILVIFGLYPFVISVFNRILLLILVFTILSPITLSYIKNRVLIFEETQLLINKLIGLLFFLSLIGVFSEILLNIAKIYPFFTSNDEFLLVYSSCKFVLFSYFYFSRFNNYLEKGHIFRIYLLMFYSLLFLGLLSLTLPIFSPIISLISIIIILTKRARNLILRFLSYLVISILISIEFLGVTGFSVILTSLQYQIILFISSLCVTLVLSIISNSKRINNLEHFALYLSLSAISFLVLYLLIPLLYNLTISAFIFLSLMGIYFHNKKDKRYKWFIKPCVLLAIFDFFSFISYAILFVSTPFSEYSNILTFSFTIFVTGLSYVLLYNDSPELFRKRSFYIVLTSNTLSFPIFIYFLLITSFSLPLFDIIANRFIIAISMNIAIVLFYISIAIYQWKVSWAIWRVGYRLWILLPFANYFLISEAFTGINVFNNALNLFGISINLFGFTLTGSYIIGFVICLLFSLPFWYTLIKKHFNNVLFIIWGLSLLLIYWFSQNAFFGNDFLINLSFFGIAFILLLPILVRMKIWSITSILWTFFSIIMLMFLYSFLAIIGFQFLINISISMVVGGFLFIILSFFPNLRAQKNIILGISYPISIIGTFLIVFDIIYLVIIQFWISLFMALIILAISLYSSRLLKLNKILFNALISGILIVSFTGLTYFTFNLIPNFELLSIYLSITVCGASFFIVNYYRLFIPAKRIIPLAIFSLGLSLSVSTFWLFVFPTLFYIFLAIFISINLIFLNFALTQRRYILWYLSPIPITLLAIQLFYFIEFFAQLFQSLILFIIISLMVYTIVFQILLNLSSTTTKYRMQIKLVNFTSFVLLSTYFSFIITVISPISILYQVLEFSILWSILILFSLGYMKKSQITFELKNLEKNLMKFASIISILLYFEIFFLILGLLNDYSSLNLLESTLISLGVFFILTILDLSLIKRISKNYCFPINYASYIVISVLLLVYLLQYVAGTFELLFLDILIVLSLQYYTIYAVFSHLKNIGHFEVAFLNSKRKAVLSLLTNCIFIIIGFYVSSFLTRVLLDFNSSFEGLPSVSFFIMSLSLFMFLLNNLLRYKSKYSILLISFIAFQISFSIFYLLSISTFSFMNLFSIFFLVVINTLMLFYSCYAISKLYVKHVKKEALHKVNSLIVVILYFEIFFLTLAGLNDYSSLNLMESMLISLGVFFILTILDLSLIKRISKNYCFPINYTSFLVISVLLLIYLFQYAAGALELLFLDILIVLSLQYYTIYAVFSHLKNMGRFELAFLNNRRKTVLSLLTNCIFIIIGFYVSSFFTRVLLDFNSSFEGLPSVFFFIMSLSLFMFLLNNLLRYKSKFSILWISFVAFQVFFSAFYLLSLSIFNFMNLFSIFFLVLVNTFMLFYSCYAISKLFVERINKETLHKVYSLIFVILYLEISFIAFALANLMFGYIESFLISQLVLISITLLELTAVKRIKRKYILIVHTLCYFNISVSLMAFLLNLTSINLSLLTIAIILFCLMQFYTNISYYNIRKEFNPEKQESFLKWRVRRKNLIGSSFYLTILIYVWQILFLAGYDFLLILFLSIILIHILAIIDRLVLKFIGRFSVHLMNYSWIFLLGFSILYYSSWYSAYSFYIIPIIAQLMLIELFYGFILKLTDIWSSFRENRVKFRNFLIISTYFNFITWPIYYINLDPFTFWGLLLLSNLVGLIVSVIDKAIKAFNEKFRIKMFRFLFTLFGLLFAIDSYFLLDIFTENTIFFNLSVSSFVFVFFMGFMIKPFKRRRAISFLYWAVTFLLLSSISYNAYHAGISWAILIVGLLLYPFIFMLEELKAFFDKFIENLSIMFKKIAAAINKMITGFINYLKRNYKIVRVLICIFFGCITGVLFSDLILHILNPFHSLLLALAIFGLLFGILPSKKSEDYDEVFKEKMTRFITLWIGVTAFIFLFVLPYIESILLSIFLLLLSILGLGAIILIYLYRLEEKERLSIKWRFWTLIIFFIILAIEIIVVVLLFVL